jgi:hypothetical protein
MSKVTQQKKILAYCNQFGSITIREAFERLKINSPSKRISELRASPLYHVESVIEEKWQSSGDFVRYKRYFIKEART